MIRGTQTSRRTRLGLTLVEMMVGTALSLTIMVILTESFKMGLDFTRYAHSVGEMTTQLGSAGQVIQRDLQAEHFLPDDTKPNRGVRLADQRLDGLPGNGWTPPKGGFFRIISPQSMVETTDSDSFAVNSAYNHALHFTSVLPGGNDSFLYTTRAGNNQSYSSRAAEIAYFLVDSGQRTSAAPSGRVLYNLIRRQRLVAYTPDMADSLRSPTPTEEPDPEVIAAPPQPNASRVIYALADLTNPANRLPVSPASPLPAPQNSPLTFQPSNLYRFGEDILVSNVLSFEVLADWSWGSVPGSTSGPRAFASGNTEYPYDNLSVNAGQNNDPKHSPGVFDTWHQAPGWNTFAAPSATALPLAVRVKAIQITIRVFDPKLKTARQNTWKFSM